MLKSEKVGVLAAVRRHRIERLTFDSEGAWGKLFVLAPNTSRSERIKNEKSVSTFESVKTDTFIVHTI